MRLLPLLLLVVACRVMPVAAQPVPPLALTPEQLLALPQVDVTLVFGNPPAPHAFRGPLLWDVLTSSGTVDPARHGDAVRQWLQVQASDGYSAVLAMGEISPEFGAKPVLLAVTLDGLALDRPRLVVPGERRPGRSARDVISVTVEAVPGSLR